MTREEIKAIIPHREPMLLIDEAWLEDGAAKGKYTVRGDEFFLQGHFPGNPTVPGVILCEMIGQSCCVLYSGDIGGGTPVYTGIDKVRFRRQVKPKDTVDITCVPLRAVGAFRFVKGEARVGGELCVSGEFSFAIIPAESSKTGD